MGPTSFLGLGGLLFVIGGVLAFVLQFGVVISLALLILSAVVAIIGAATRSALVWVGVVGATLFGGMLLFAFLAAIP